VLLLAFVVLTAYPLSIPNGVVEVVRCNILVEEYERRCFQMPLLC
jgi:hypothetical protein